MKKFPTNHFCNGSLQKYKMLIIKTQKNSTKLVQNWMMKNSTNGGEFPLPFALVPWGQHIEIIVNCKTLDEALFYVRETIEKGLSRPALRNVIKANLFEHQGKIINNFSEHLPALQSKLVQEVLKENYDFGFATVSHEIYDEAELEEALSKEHHSHAFGNGNRFCLHWETKGNHCRRSHKKD